MPVDKKDLIPPGLKYLADNIRNKDNILGASKSDGARWAKALNLPESGKTLFFAGCGFQYADKLETLSGLIRKMDKSPIGSDLAMSLAGLQKKLGVDAAGTFLKIMGKGIAEEALPLKAAIKILRKIGIQPSYLGESEPCCGGILHYMGLKKEFNQRSARLYQTLSSKGATEIISIVPSCTYTLSKLAREAAPQFDLKVKHFTQTLADNLGSLSLKYPQPVKVTYHDPCQLVRYLGLKDEPRKILKAIKNVELVEPKSTCGDFSTCCGGGGGFEAVFPELSEILAVNRVKELVDTGAQVLVTNCPGCMLQLEVGLKIMKRNDLQVLDLAQIVALSLEA